MPSLDDLPTLASFTPSGDDLIPIYDLTGSGSSKVRKVSLNQINGVSTADVVTSVAGAITVSTRLTLITSGTTSTVTVPEPSGVLRDFIVMNGGTGTATLATPSSAVVFKTSLVTTAAASTPLLTTGTARYLSDGVFWYRTH
jgi:hypothetical protein